MTTFWATMLLQTFQKQDFVQLFFTNILLNVDRIRNYFAVRSGKNSSGLTTLIDCTVLAYFEP
jgi:hypothetical protein